MAKDSAGGQPVVMAIQHAILAVAFLLLLLTVSFLPFCS